MKRILLLSVCTLAFVGCEQHPDKNQKSMLTADNEGWMEMTKIDEIPEYSRHRNGSTEVEIREYARERPAPYGTSNRDIDMDEIDIQERNIPRDATQTNNDQAITQKLMNMLRTDNTLSNYAKNINVSTSNGVIVLRGFVINDLEMASIAKKANSISGVKNVNNQLRIRRP